MSMSGSIVLSVLDKAVKYSMTPDDVAELYNNIVDILEWDNDCAYTIEDVIVVAKSIVDDKYYSNDKKPYSKWLELHGE